MNKPTVDEVVTRGPEAVRELVAKLPPASAFDPAFSWQLVAVCCAFECAVAGEQVVRARWAAAAADIYELLARVCEIMEDRRAGMVQKVALRYRALSEGCW